jgi:hypothetical protein
LFDSDFFPKVLRTADEFQYLVIIGIMVLVCTAAFPVRAECARRLAVLLMADDSLNERWCVMIRQMPEIIDVLVDFIDVGSKDTWRYRAALERVGRAIDRSGAAARVVINAVSEGMWDRIASSCDMRITANARALRSACGMNHE